MMQTKLSGIPETLLIPLWAKAVESNNKNPIIIDTKAEEIIAEIDYDFSKFKNAKMSQLGVAIRTMILDLEVSRFLKRNPSTMVINLGAGLDTRYARLNPGNAIWYELDIPESTDLRKEFFNESDNYRFISKSMFDYSWIDDISIAERSVLFIAEGLLMYFKENELKTFLKEIVNRFHGAEMLIEVMGTYLVGKSKKHDSVSKIKNAPEFKWGIKNSKDLQSWHPDIRFVNEWCYFDYHKDRAGLAGYFIRLPFVRPHIAPRIVHLQINGF